MAKTNAFKIAELIRAITFDVDNDEIVTSKKIQSKNKKTGGTTYTATTEVALDTFAHASFSCKICYCNGRGNKLPLNRSYVGSRWFYSDYDSIWNIERY